MSDVKIRLLADTNKFKKDIQDASKALKSLDKSSTNTSQTDKSKTDSQLRQSKIIDSLAQESKKKTRNTLDDLKKYQRESLKNAERDASNIYDAKRRELEAKKRLLDSAQGSSSNGGGGNSSKPPGGSGGGAGGSSDNPLATLGSLALIARSIHKFVSDSSNSALQGEKLAYKVYNTTGMFGSDFNRGRNYASEVGSPFGYTPEESMNLQQSILGGTGFTNQQNLTTDSGALMKLSKAYGLDLSAVGQVASSYGKTGVFNSGEQTKFANLLASSIREAGMVGREGEQLEVLNSINSSLEHNSVNVGEGHIESAMGLYNILARDNSALKGTRGSTMVQQMNNAMVSGNNQMDLLLGWGTQYTGAQGKWALELAKERGISDTENLKNVFSNYEKFTPYSIDSAQGKMTLQSMFGLSASEVEELISHKEEILNETYKANTSSGESETDKYFDSYKNSKVATDDKFKSDKADATQDVGNVFNSITAPFKSLFSKLPDGVQGLGSVAWEGIKGYGIYKLFNGIFKGGFKGGLGDLFKNGFKGGLGGGLGSLFKGSEGAGLGSLANGLFGAGATVMTGGLIKRSGILDSIKQMFTGKSSESIDLGSLGSGYQDEAKSRLQDYVQAGFSDKNIAEGTTGQFLSEDDLKSLFSYTGKDGKLHSASNDEVVNMINQMFPSEAGKELKSSKVFLGQYDETGINEWLSKKVAKDSKAFGINKLYGKESSELADSAQERIKGYKDVLGDRYQESVNTYASAVEQEKENIENRERLFGVSEKSEVTVKSSGNSSSTVATDTKKKKPSLLSRLFGGFFGSFAVGEERVPYDNFPALLHKDEAVLTAHEAKQWREKNSVESIVDTLNSPASVSVDSPQQVSTGNSSSNLNIHVSGKIEGMTAENESTIVRAIVTQLQGQSSDDSILGSLGNSFTRVSY